MEKDQVLKVASVSELKQDKNGMNYKQIVYQTFGEERIVDPTGKTVLAKAPVRKSSRNAWEHNYLEVSMKAKELNKKIEKLTSKDLEGIEPDFGFDFEAGTCIFGSIETRTVEPYSIPDVDGVERVVDTYTKPIFGKTTDPFYDKHVEREMETDERIKLIGKEEKNPTVEIKVEEEEEELVNA